jgi:ATP-dependent Clp protease, protease subunit
MDLDKDEPTAASRLLEEKLFQRRTILISGGITEHTARSVSERLLAMSAAGTEPINVYISSPGGHVESGDVIHDVIKFIRPEVRTIGSGWVASAGALIFVAPKRENRFCLPNTRFLLHQPSGGIFGTALDIAIQAEQIVKMRERLNQIFADATGQPIERIEKDTHRDFWMTPKQAIDYGLLGSVIRSETELS